MNIIDRGLSRQLFCIDYRNGAMGNTVLSHILYSCGKINDELDNLVDSQTGNFHNVKIVNNTNLIAHHLQEYPDSNMECILEILCNNWAEILRLKMSYSKWHKEEPELGNYKKFFSYIPSFNKEQLWAQFYQDFRDQSWPEVCKYSDVKFLPDYIQQEIFKNFFEASDNLNSELLWAEWLSVTYYDLLNKVSVKNFVSANTLELTEYLRGNVSALINVSQQLGWEWDPNKSNLFLKKVLLANQPYFRWLRTIEDAVSSVLQKNHQVNYKFKPWEQALIIAKFCQDNNIDPKVINWVGKICDTDKNNVYLNQFKRTYHGKTI